MLGRDVDDDLHERSAVWIAEWRGCLDNRVLEVEVVQSGFRGARQLTVTHFGSIRHLSVAACIIDD